MAMQLFAKGAEVKLVEMLNALDEPAGWHAAHFHLDRLLEEYKSDYQVKIAINLINDLLKDYEGAVFLFTERDILVVFRGVERVLQNKLIFQLRYLYMDDALAYNDEGQENPEFCTSYALDRDWKEFLDMASKRMARIVRKPGQKEPQAPSVTSLSAASLANVEEDVWKADVSKALRSQPICAVLPGSDARKVFDEIYVHIAHLRQMLKKEVDFFSNRWLFKYLTQTLDARVLEIIGRDPAHYLQNPISLNLNAETLLSEAFSAFNAAVPAAMKVAVVVEVPVVDVFADITGFTVARREVQKMGYRVCLDGLTAKNLIHIDREHLGVDLLKVQWNADAGSDLQTAENRELAAAIQRCGTKRIILCRCDSKNAIEYGQALGVSLFQGRYLDGLLNPSASLEN